MGRDGRAVVVDVRIQCLEDELRFLEPLPVDVVKREVGILQRLAAHAVAQDITDKHRTARPHESDLGHFRPFDCCLAV